MNKPITIMLPIVPPTKTHQNKKIVNIGKHAKLADTKELKLVISDYLTLLKPYQPARPDGAGLPEAGLRLALPQERAEKKTGSGSFRKRPNRTGTTWPKPLQDVLTRLRFWEDDAQVYSASVDKWWGEEPQITITVQEGSEP